MSETYEVDPIDTEDEDAAFDAYPCGVVGWDIDEPDGGPIGFWMKIPDGQIVHCGEISRDLWEAEGMDDYFDDDFGWYLKIYGTKESDTEVLAKVAGREAAEKLVELVGKALIAGIAEPTL